MPDVGTVVLTETTFPSIKKVKFAWTSDGSGNATLTTLKSYTGECVRLITVPGTVGDQPTAYSVAINDEDGVDVLVGAGATRSTTLTQQVLASSLGCVVNSQLTISVTGAGSGKKGTLYLYIR